MKLTRVGCVFVLAALLAGAQACDENKPAPPAPAPTASAAASATAAASASAAAARPHPQKGTGKDPNTKGTATQLPGVNELYYQAKHAGLTDDWMKKAAVKPKDYGKMKPGERAIEVGILLADLAVINSDPAKPVPTDTLEEAKKAIESLSPPPSVGKRIDEVIGKAKGGLKGEELRIAIDHVVQDSIPDMESDPKLKATADLVRIGAYLHSMALASKALSSVKEPDKLVVLTRGDEQAYFKQALDSLPEDLQDPLVKKAIEAVGKIDPYVAKQQPEEADAKAVAAALTAFAK